MLTVKSIDAFFGKIQVLRKISLHVLEEEIVALIGANGAGKTTLLNVVSGLHPLKGGNIIFLQREIGRFSPERIVAQGIIQVPESNKLFDPLTVLENLELGAYLRFSRSKKAQIERDLDYVYTLFPVLRNRKKQLAGTLSGGERQMLALGKAMMGSPRLMMLDEPSLGLAPLVISEIFETIESLNQGGMTFLLVEQNAKAALRISHRAYVMETGKITLTGAGEELSENVEVKRAFLGKDYREKWER